MAEEVLPSSLAGVDGGRGSVWVGGNFEPVDVYKLESKSSWFNDL